MKAVKFHQVAHTKTGAKPKAKQAEQVTQKAVRPDYRQHSRQKRRIKCGEREAIKQTSKAKKNRKKKELYAYYAVRLSLYL